MIESLRVSRPWLFAAAVVGVMMVEGLLLAVVLHWAWRPFAWVLRRARGR